MSRPPQSKIYTCPVCCTRRATPIQHAHTTHAGHAPPALDPTNNVARKPKRVCGVEQTLLRALKHVALVDEVVERLTALREHIIEPRVRFLRERVLAQRVRLSRRRHEIWLLRRARVGIVRGLVRKRRRLGKTAAGVGGVGGGGRGRGCKERSALCVLVLSRQPAASAETLHRGRKTHLRF
jgi:hypothetical protein